MEKEIEQFIEKLEFSYISGSVSSLMTLDGLFEIFYALDGILIDQLSSTQYNDVSDMLVKKLKKSIDKWLITCYTLYIVNEGIGGNKHENIRTY